MEKSIRVLLCFLSIIIFVTSCNKKELDEFYGRPANLAPPIYEQLKANGLTSMLAVIDKAGYKDILGQAGYWTVFAPSDEAFQQFLQERNLSSINDLDKKTATDIVRYNTVYASYLKANMNDLLGAQSGVQGAFRKQTTYYDFAYPEDDKMIVAANTNSGYSPGSNYSRNNNKYLPVFTDDFFNYTAIPESDYSTLFGVPFSGFNVGDAKVLKSDIVAENGVIHSIDKVLTPVQSIDQYLASNPDYSEFRKLLQLSASYSTDNKVQQRYFAISGGATDPVYIKTYNADVLNLPVKVWPNNENTGSAEAGGVQMDMMSIAVPTNDQVTAYKQYLLANWGGNELSPEMVMYFVNAHIWDTTVWPSRLSSTVNTFNELPTFSTGDIREKKVLSNGLFYGINNIWEANVFRTVYSKPFLNKEYGLQTRAMNETAQKGELSNPLIKTALLMISDDQWRAAGFDYNTLFNQWEWTSPAGAFQRGDLAQRRVHRILNMSAFDNSLNQADNLSTGSAFLKGFGDVPEYVKYSDGKLQASGNMEDNTFVTITGKEVTVNGPAYFTTGMLKYSEKTLGKYIEDLAVGGTSPVFGTFYNYLKRSSVWTDADKSITGVTAGVPYTVLIPTNTAIQAAVTAGKLPSLTVTNWSLTQQEQVAQFIQYHFLARNTLVSDGDPSPEKQGKQQTVLTDDNLLPDPPITYIDVVNNKNSMLFTDKKGNVANLVLPSSNNLANMAAVHAIDNVLFYK
ncbi:fasciclin domain-containing protein [Pedobacter sp. P351]|uniref:fasciclin domain-containing protein n=1 Tax=Pedobacter superstes TaxID=3133441 RepID=UPI00309FA27E